MHITFKNKILFTFFLMVVSISANSQSNNFKVTLDAGHGGHDFGANYSGHVEKNIALAVVLKVGKILENTANTTVFYTRKTDVFIDLVERANIANRADANIFVSIHCNANRNTAGFGTETYVMGMTKIESNLEAAKKENAVITLEKDYKKKYEGFDPNSPETMIGMTLMQEEYLDNSISLASKVQDEFVALGKKSRGGGVKQAPYMVLHKAYMPRVLIEMGFISNPEEGNILDSEEGQNAIAIAIASAITKYKTEYYGTGEPETFEVKPLQKSIEKQDGDTENTVKPKMNLGAAGSGQSSNKSESDMPLFKVQLSASIKKMNLEPRNFRGLSNLSMAFDNNVYKYMYGATTNYEEAKKQLQEAKQKGYASAFLIAFKNGVRVAVEEGVKN